MPPQRPARPQGEPPPDLAEQPLPLPLRHADVPREGAQQRDVLFGIVGTLPVVLPDGHHREQPGRLDLRAVVGKLPRARPHGSRRQPLPDFVVDLLDLREERIAVLRQDVRRRPEREMPAGPQGLPRPQVPYLRVDPVPRGGREDQREPRIRPPVLEAPLGHRDGTRAAARHRRESRAEFDAGHRVAAPGEGPGGLSGGAADLEHRIAGRQAGAGDEVIEKRLGIVRAHPVIGLRRLVKRFPQPLSLAVCHHAESIPASPSAITRRVSQPRRLPSRGAYPAVNQDLLIYRTSAGSRPRGRHGLRGDGVSGWMCGWRCRLRFTRRCHGRTCSRRRCRRRCAPGPPRMTSVPPRSARSWRAPRRSASGTECPRRSPRTAW